MPLNFRKTIFAGVAASLAQCPRDGLPEIVLSGRSNVGKSSLINTIAGVRQLARVSSTPGKTRLVVYFCVDQRLYLTDLPGYGFTRTGQERRKELSALVDSYLTSGRPIALVLHLMDIRHEPSALDIQMIDWLEANAIPYRVILTKCDKLSRQQIQQQVQQITSQLDLAEDVGLIPFSAADRTGLLEIRALIAGAVGETALTLD